MANVLGINREQTEEQTDGLEEAFGAGNSLPAIISKQM